MKRTLLAVPVLAAILVWALSSPGATRAPSSRHCSDRDTAQRTAPAPEKPRPGVAGGVGLRTGDVARYAFAVDHDLTLRGMMPSEHAPRAIRVRKHRRGVLVLEVYGREGDGWAVGLSLEQLAFSRAVHEAPASAERALVESLTGKAFAALTSSGRFNKVVYPGHWSARGREVVAALLARWRVVRSNDPAATEWETEETDATGRFRARYTLRDNNGTREIIKRKLAYTTLAAKTRNGAPAKAQVDAETRIELDPLPRTIRGRESVRVEMGAADRLIESVLSFRFERRSLTQTELDSAEVQWTADARPEIDRSADARAQLAALDGVLAAGGARSRAENRVLIRLVQLVKESDTATAAIVERLESASCDEERAILLATVLSAGGTPAAQNVVCRMLTEPRWSRQQRRAALFSLPNLAQPLPEVDEALMQIERSDDAQLAATAFLLRAASGAKVRATDPARHARVRDDVMARLATDDPRELTLALDALGNLRPQTVPAALAQAAEHESEMVRGAALRALTVIPTKTAKELIEAMANDDGSEELRRLAERALKRHRYSAIERAPHANRTARRLTPRAATRRVGKTRGEVGFRAASPFSRRDDSWSPTRGT